jgi:hypothetical protein
VADPIQAEALEQEANERLAEALDRAAEIENTARQLRKHTTNAFASDVEDALRRRRRPE